VGSESSSRFRTQPRGLTSFGPRGEGWVGLQSALGLLVLFSAPLTRGAWPDELAAILTPVGIVLVLAGIGLFVLGGITLGHSFSIWIKPREGGELAQDGIYRWMRHPVCTAQVFIGIGWALAWGSLVALALMPIYAWYLDRYKLAIEERWLLETYPGYDAYREAVRHRMIPWPPGRSARGG
jgi:protein-S-isoprenylcysteine O-methyltransferase Ste14